MADAPSILSPASSDPYASFSSPAPAAPAPAKDPYAEFSDPAPTASKPAASDPYADFSELVTKPPPLSEDDFQAKLKTRWGPMLTGQSMASPTDITEMRASGKFTPEQIQSVQTETALRQQYIDEQAHPFANLAGSAVGLVKNVTVLPRLWEAYKDISANPTGYANDTERVASGVTEGLSDAVIGAGQMVAAPFQYAYSKAFPSAPLTPEQQYQQWKVNRVSSQQTPGYGAPHTTSRVQDSLSYLTGAPAESFPQPVAAASELASTAGSIPLFGGATGAAGVLGKGALKATGAADIASKYAPTLSAFGDTASAQAARIRNAANEAVEPGSTPVDVTGALSRAGTSALSKVGEKAGDTISGVGKAANTIAEKIGSIPGMDSNAAQLLASVVVGPKAVIVAEGALKTLEKLGPKAVDLGDAMGRIATASPADPFGRLMSIAADSDAPPWLKTFVKNPAIQFAAKAGTLGAGAAKGLATGAATGAALSIVSGDSPEDTLENAMNFGAFGAMHGGLSAKEGKVFNANIGAVSKFITDSLAAGTSPETLKAVPLSDILQAAQMKYALPDQTVRFSTPMDAGSPFGPSGDAVGQAGFYDSANKTLWIDPTKRAPGSTLLHESYHPIFDNLGQQPEIKSSINSAFKNSGSTLDEFKQQYAAKVFPDDPQAAADFIKSRDAASPDWAYSEILSESAAHNLDGKDLLPAMQGQVIDQSATQKALAGVSGWLNEMGVDLQKRQGTGTIFPDFTESLNDPGLRQLTYKLLKAQRDTLTNPPVENPGVPLKPQDIGTAKAPLYTGPNGEKFNAYGRVVNNQFKAWPASEIKRRGLAEKAALRKYFPEAGKLVTSMPAGLEADPNITPWTKASLRAQFDSIQSKDKLSLWYHRLNSENSATSDKSRGADIARNQGNVQVSYQSGQPLGIKRTAKDNIISQFHSEEAENQKLAAWAQRHGPLSLDLWNGDIAKVKEDIQTYLQNHATGQPGDANGVGAAKRDVINALLAGGNKEFEAKNPLRAGIRKADRQGIIRDLRADRMESPSVEPAQRPPANWESLKHNLSPSEDPNAIKAAAVRDRKTGKIFPGTSHVGARARSPKSGESLEDGFVTNSGKFLLRDQALEQAIAAKQYKPTDEDSNFISKKLYGLTSERFNKQNPNVAYGAQWMPEIAGPKPGKRMGRYSPAAESKTRTPDEDIRAQAADYTKEAGISHSPFIGYAPLNEDLGKRVADAYEAAPHIPDDPKVKAAYQALATETRAQWDYLTKKGVTFEPWTKEGQPYASSKEMRKDVQDNKHLFFFPTEQGFGEGKQGSNNPMLALTGVESRGMPLVANDMFRAVHDYFGHAKEGYEFGPRGEYNAYLAHSRMFSDTARSALTAETMGQNSWVNFGKHLRDEAGNIPKKGEKGYIAPQDRPFAEQKATVLPEDLTKESLTPAEKQLQSGHAAAGQPIIARDTKDGWEVLDGQHRVSQAIKDGAKSLPAYIPVEDKAKTFSPASEDSAEPLYYSKLKNTVDEKFSGESMPAAQLAAILRNPSNGVKADELKWSGIDDFLKGKHRVSKEEVRDYLDSQDLTPVEVTKKAPEEQFHWGEDDIDNPSEWGLHVVTKLRNGEPTQIESVGITVKKKVNDDGSERFRVFNRDTANRGSFASLEDAKANAESEAKGYWQPDDGQTAYKKYSLPGPKENYREILFQLPKIPSAFESSHWDERNVVAHARVDDRNNVEGKPGLFVEEIQSDWHQQGRKEGYQDKSGKEKSFSDALNEAHKGYELAVTPAREALEKARLTGTNVALYGAYAAYDKASHAARLIRDAAIRDAHTRFGVSEEGWDHISSDEGKVPDAPLKNTWQETVFRRLVQMAAQTGKDWVGWTTGSQNADRYGLEKHLSGIRWDKTTGELNGRKHGNKVFVQLAPRVDAYKLPDYIGKELAENLVNSKPDARGFNELTGLDLKVGGEGMAGFYDKILVDYANKFGKKFGARALGTILGEDDEGALIIVHSLSITPEMKKSVTESGIPFYSPAGGGAAPKSGKTAQSGKLAALAASVAQQKQQP